MTENEAIEVLNNFDMQVSAKADGAYQSTIGEMACGVAVKALSEIQQYRAIGTIEKCREAREVKHEITEIVNQQLIAGKNNYKEVYGCFCDIAKVIQDHY